MSKPPSYQRYARDWLVATAHLTLEEQGAYQRLLDHEWIEGPMPNDGRELSRRLSISRKKFDRIWKRITRFFEKNSDGKLFNDRLEQERCKQLRYRELQKEKSLKAARAREAQREVPRDVPREPLSSAVCSLQFANPPSGGVDAPSPPSGPISPTNGQATFLFALYASAKGFERKNVGKCKQFFEDLLARIPARKIEEILQSPEGQARYLFEIKALVDTKIEPKKESPDERLFKKLKGNRT